MSYNLEIRTGLARCALAYREKRLAAQSDRATHRCSYSSGCAIGVMLPAPVIHAIANGYHDSVSVHVLVDDGILAPMPDVDLSPLMTLQLFHDKWANAVARGCTKGTLAVYRRAFAKYLAELCERYGVDTLQTEEVVG